MLSASNKLIQIAIPYRNVKPNFKYLFVIDTSQSMNQEAITKGDDGKEKKFGFNLLDISKHALLIAIEELEPEDYLAVIAFNHNVTKVLTWTKKSDIIDTNIEKIRSLQTSGTTDFVKAFSFVYEMINELSYDSKNLVNFIFFTDGVSNTQPDQSYNKFFKSLQRKDFETPVIMYTVGCGNNIDSTLLASISPFGFYHMPDAGCVGAITCNLMAFAKSISCVSVQVTTSDTPRTIEIPLHNIIIKIGKRTEFLGPLAFELPRHLMISESEQDKTDEIRLMQNDILIAKLQVDEQNIKYYIQN